MQITKRRSRLIRVSTTAFLALLVLWTLASPAPGDDGQRNVAPPEAFYLSLGDSNAFGLQFDRLFEMLDAGTYTPDAFHTGYTDVLAARMHGLRPGQQTVNLSCPGESTDTMINGGCFFTLPDPAGPGLALHTSYAGSQLDAALSFLRSHQHQVSPVTVSIGGIDAADVIAGTCNFAAACVEQSGLRDSLGRGLDHILGALRAAAPDAEVILVVFYNPFSISNPGSNGLWHRNFITVERDAARRNGVRLVDTSEIVNGSRVCQLTFLCASGDSHPTDEGYRRIGDQIYRVARLARP